MSDDTDVNLLFVLSFDNPLFVEPNILGAKVAINLPSSSGRLIFPDSAQPSAGSWGLVCPAAADERIGRHLTNGWGVQSDPKSYAEVNAVLVEIPIHAKLSFELAGNQIGGEDVRSMLNEVSAWFDSFSHWLWVISAQPLDPMNPDPKVLHRQSLNVFYAASSPTAVSLTAVGSPTIIVTDDLCDPTSERLINRKILRLAAGRAHESSPPLMWELLASARMAGRRGDTRRALIDAGTAAEAALSSLLFLPQEHQLTLGQLVKRAVKQRLAVPSDTKTALVLPRNDAVHRGQLSNSCVCRALEITEELVALADPQFVRMSALRPVHRPQRLDLTIISPKSAPADIRE